MIFLVYVRFIVGIVLLIISLGLFIIQVAGVFKLKYVLNRMHNAAIGDAIGLGTAFLGLILLNGLNFTTLKLLIVPCFLLFTSPVSSHLIAKMEIQTTQDKNKYRLCHVSELDDEEGNPVEEGDNNDSI